MIQAVSEAYEMRYVDLATLRVDSSYQREVIESEVSDIVNDFEPRAYGPLHLGQRRNGDLYIIDGRQRAEAGKRLEFENVAAWIVAETTPMVEAELFLKLNRDRTNVHALDRFKAAIKSREETALAIQKAVESCGFEVPHGKKEWTRTWPQIGCIEAVSAIWRDGELIRVLKTISRNWTEIAGALDNTIIRGLGEFFKRFGDTIDQSRVDTILSQTAPDELLSQAQAIRRMTGGSRHIGLAKHMTSQYNMAKNIKTIRKLPTSKQLEWN